MTRRKSKMDKLREEFREFLEEEGFNETINDELNEIINDCGVEFGKYARMVKLYLEENYWDKYYDLILSREFIKYFQSVEERASKLYEKHFDEYLAIYQDEDFAKVILYEFITKEIVEADCNWFFSCRIKNWNNRKEAFFRGVASIDFVLQNRSIFSNCCLKK